jgi:hypothetical protein
MHAPVLLQQPFGHVVGPQGGAASPAMVPSTGASLGGEVSPLEPSWGLPSAISGHVSVSVQTMVPQPSMSTVAAMAIAVAAAARK